MENSSQQIVPSSDKKDGTPMKIKIIVGPLRGQIFDAKKVLEQNSGQDIYCYHIVKDGVKTYFVKKDIIEIA